MAKRKPPSEAKPQTALQTKSAQDFAPVEQPSIALARQLEALEPQTKSAQDFTKIYGQVSQVRPEFIELADTIKRLYLQERQDSQRGKDLGRRAILANSGLIANILQSVSLGLTPAQAAKANFTSSQTVTDHIKQGDDDERQGVQSAHALFSVACQSANEQRRQHVLTVVRSAALAGPQFWPAAAWEGERTFGDDYKNNQDKQIANITVQVGVFTKADIAIPQQGESPTHNALPDIVIPSSPSE